MSLNQTWTLSMLSLALLLSTVSSKITVIMPEELAFKFQSSISASYANFGKIPYGFSTRGTLFYDTNPNKDPNYSCKPLNLSLPASNDQVDYYPIIIVEQGACSYVQMARNIQHAGASMAIIISNTAMSGHDVKEISVSDDGTGSDIIIQTVWISQTDGLWLTKFWNQNLSSSSVVLEVEFNTKKSEVPKLEIFMHSTSKEAYAFLDEFSSYYNILASDIIFEPHFISHQWTGWSEEQKLINCVSKGTYCMPSYPTAENNNGKYIILENITQYCIYLLSSRSDESPTQFAKLFFDFVSFYYKNCDFSSAYRNNCGWDLLPNYGLSIESVNKCIAKTFGESNWSESVFNNNQNTYLESEMHIANSLYINEYPTVLVNKKKLHGRWNALDIFDTICSSFIVKPQKCKDYLVYPTNNNKGLGWFNITLIVIGALIVNILIVILCRKYIVRRVHERIEVNELDWDGRINAVVTNYFALKDPDGK